MGETDKAVVIVRKIGAPSADVYKAWTDPSILCRWLAPGESVVVDAKTDLRIGGRYSIQFRSPEGDTHEFAGVYRELRHPMRIEKTWTYSGPVGFLRDSPSIVQVDIRELGPRLTEFTLTHRQISTQVACDAYQADWPTCMEKLDAVFCTDEQGT